MKGIARSAPGVAAAPRSDPYSSLFSDWHKSVLERPGPSPDQDRSSPAAGSAARYDAPHNAAPTCCAAARAVSSRMCSGGLGYSNCPNAFQGRAGWELLGPAAWWWSVRWL